MIYRDASSVIATRFSAADVALLTGTTAVMAYGFYNNFQARHGTSPLGPGATVASLVVSLNVPNPKDSNSIIPRLHKLSSHATTSTRKGVQDLVTEVCLELSRQERSIVSAVAESRHFTMVSQAEREFREVSVRNRSKLEKESGVLLVSEALS